MAKGGINRKGQGLPVNLIIILIIGIIILLLVIAFATGTLGKLFGGAKELGEAVTPEQVATFRIGCKQACFSAEQLADTKGEWTNSDYCQRKLGSYNCWSKNVTVDCSKNVTIEGVEYMFSATSTGCYVTP